ncbi:MAG TPA: hypothetical protein VFY92_10750 [Hyphomicrobiaceae bacterium]|nr:hypothetical protein [Hyphomicrobiaceae bacterium]
MAAQKAAVVTPRWVNFQPTKWVSFTPALTCVFFSDDGKALLLVGQWLLSCRSFPSRSFRLYRWADTRKPIRIKSTGRRIRPEDSAACLRASHRLSDVEVFEATPETLQHDLDNAFGKTVA